jgi:uncharacterized phiE125 gp8 family phage protein
VPSFTDIGCAWTLVTGPASEPITLTEAKSQARITDTNSDSLISSYITVARQEAETYLGRGLYTQTWKLSLDWFTDVIPLPMAAPLASITSVKYYDEDGTLQTLSTSYYDTDTVAQPGTVVLKPDQTWPSVQSDRRNRRVEITYVVGWSATNLIPELIKQGIRLYVTYLDLDRDGMEDRALAAKQAAERCWSDRVYWTPPRWC